MADLVKKDIRYLGKDFAQFRQNLITFTKQYFPNTYQDFNESSPGMMFMEMASYVGDVLSYYTDQAFRESLLSGAQEEQNVLMLSQLFGYRPRLNSPAHCKLDVYQLVPAIGAGEAARPDYTYALSIQNGMEVLTGDDKLFRTAENIDFNDNPDVSVYETDGSGNITYYLLKKQTTVVSGEVVTREFAFDDPKQYDKILIPETNVLEILSVTSDTGQPWYEVNYLAQDTVFEDIANIEYNDPSLSQHRSTVPYILKLRKTPRRYISRVRSDLTTELQFGSGISSDADEEIIPNPKNVGSGLEYLRRTTTSNLDPSNFLATSTYGLAPNNETLTVKYTIGGGIKDNVGVNTIININSITYLNDNSTVDLSIVKDSVAVNNPEPARGGTEKQTIESIRQNAIASFAAQNRIITREDYIARIYALPPKYGAVAKAYVIGDTQQNTQDIDYPRDTIANPLALNLYLLGYDSDHNLVSPNNALKENIRTYLSEFRMLTDAISIKSAHIVNLIVNFEIIPKARYNNDEVLTRCIDRLKMLLHTDKMQINGSINISELTSELDQVEGVQSVPTINIQNTTKSGYSNVVYNIAAATRNNIIYPSLDPCIFEIKYPNLDIKGRVIKP
ncbi:hypothetical protein CMI37_18755 [Candidatus Pacearchaeota archaeon]|nr:hypothetical protein [Candidatus Pacearchaeota archaeon]